MKVWALTLKHTTILLRMAHILPHTTEHKTITNYMTEGTDNEHLVINSMVNKSDMDVDTFNTGTDSGILVTNSSSNSQEIENN